MNPKHNYFVKQFDSSNNKKHERSLQFKTIRFTGSDIVKLGYTEPTEYNCKMLELLEHFKAEAGFVFTHELQPNPSWNGDDEYSPYLTVFKYEHFYFWFEQNDCGLIEDLDDMENHIQMLQMMKRFIQAVNTWLTDDNILDDFDKYVYEHFFKCL